MKILYTAIFFFWFSLVAVGQNHHLPAERPITRLTQNLAIYKTLSNQPDFINKITSRSDQDQPVHILSSRWKLSEDNWDEAKQEWRTYNPENQLFGVLEQSKIDGKWVDQTRTTFLYNEQKQLRLFQYDAWDGVSWHLYTRFIYEYDAAQHITSFITQDWIGDMWVNRTRKLFTYSDYPDSKETILQSWMHDAWVNLFRDTEFFNAEQMTASSMHEEWDHDHWDAVSRQVYTYTDQNQVANLLLQQVENGVWVDHLMTTYEYDATGNVSYQSAHWLHTTCHQDDYAWQYQYDDRNNLVQSTNLTEDHGDWQYKGRSTFIYDDQNRLVSSTGQSYQDVWINREFVQYGYPVDTTISVINVSHEMQVFPNPVDDEFYLTIPTSFTEGGICSIYSLDGRLYSTQTFSQSACIEIETGKLPAGTFVVKLSGGKQAGVKSFVKE